MNNDALRQFEAARKIGPLALLRLRAEVLLKHGDNGVVPLTIEERAQLERIAVVPNRDDVEFLGTFDRFLEE